MKRSLLILALLFWGLNLYGKDTVRVGVEYSRDTVFDFYHPRHWAIQEGDTLVFFNTQGLNTTAPTNSGNGFPTFSTSETNPYYQFHLNTGIYQFYNQNFGVNDHGTLYVNPTGTQCSVDFTVELDSLDPTGANFHFKTDSNVVWASWDFNDGILTTGSKVSHRFLTSGAYDVALTVRFANGCYASIKKLVHVNIVQAPVCQALFSYVQVDSLSLQLSNSSINLDSSATLRWFSAGTGTLGFGDSLLVSFQDTGWTEVCLEVGGASCSDTICQWVYVSQVGPCQNGFTYHQDSNSFNLVFQGGISGLTNPQFSWSFGDGSNSNIQSPSHLYPGPGKYLVCFTAFDPQGCQVGFCDSVLVEPLQCTTGFSILGNQPQQVSLKAEVGTGNPIQYLWDFGLGLGDTAAQFPTVNFPSGGAYPICLQVVYSNSCHATFCDTVWVLDSLQCQADFQVTTNHELASFVNSSSNTLGYPQAYFWDFGDGQTSSAVNPNHIYQQSGNYLVCLTVQDSSGTCSSSFCDSVSIQLPTCQSDFTISSTSWNGFRFLNQSQKNGSTTYTWSFGNGSFSYQKSPIYTYSSPGTYVVCLSLTDSLGCSSTHCDTLYVAYPQTCDVSFSSSIHPSLPQVTLINTSVNPGNPGQYVWDLGNGMSSQADSLVYQYSNYGVYDVSLTYSDSSTGCDSTLSRQLVIPPPGNCYGIFRIKPDTTLGSYTFQAFTGAAGSILSVKWDFGDGDSASGLNPGIYSYLEGGGYEVCLTIETSQGCSSTWCDSLVVPDLPCRVKLEAQKDTLPYTYSFTAKPGGAGPFAYTWGFAQANPSQDSSSSPSGIEFIGPGAYPISLTMVDSSGCQTTTIDTLSIEADCRAGFTVQNLGNLDFQFLNQSIGQSLTAQFSWDFGDGNTSNQTHPNHTYAQPGLYVVKMTLSDTLYGCTDTLSQSVFIPTPCLADFSFVVDSNLQRKVHFDASASLGTGTLLYVWDFNDGNIAQGPTVSHTFSQGGVYNVCLTLTDSLGCTTTFCDFVQVQSAGICRADFLAWPDTSLGRMEAYSFKADYYGSEDALYTWDFGDGTQRLSGPLEHHTYTQLGWQQVCLLVEDTTFAGAYCVDSFCLDVFVDTIFFKEVPGFSHVNVGQNTILFTNESIRLGFPNPSTTQIGYHWDFGDGTSSSLVNPAHTYAQPGVYAVCLTVTDLQLSQSRTACNTQIEASVQIGLDEIPIPEVVVYPNPTQGRLNLEIGEGPFEFDALRIVDLTGRTVWYRGLNAPDLNGKMEIDLSQLQTGLYILTLEGMGQGLHSEKLFIHR